MKNMEKVVQEQLDAYNAGDLDRFCRCYHPEVSITRFVSGVKTVSGMDEFREVYRALFESSPKLNCQVKSRIVLENVIMDEEFVTGHSKMPEGIHVVVTYGFRDGLIDRVWLPR